MDDISYEVRVRTACANIGDIEHDNRDGRRSKSERDVKGVCQTPETPREGVFVLSEATSKFNEARAAPVVLD